MDRFLLILFCLITAIIPVYSEKTTIAIIDFSAKGEIENEKFLADAIVENLITSFIESDEFIVIERSMLKDIMRELQLQNSDDFNDELRSQIGKLYSAKLVILGSLTKIGARYTINVRGVEVETGVAKFAKNLTTDSKESLVDLIPQIVSLITGKEIIKDKIKENKTATEPPKISQEIKPLMTLNKNEFHPGEEISLEFKAPDTYQKNAWIGIIPSRISHGSEKLNDENDMSYQYISNRTAGSMTFYAPVEAGDYDFRMNDNDNNGNEVFYIFFKVKTDEINSSSIKIITDKEIFNKGEPIAISYEGLPGNSTDWLTLVPENAPNDSYNEWFYTKGAVNGSYQFKPVNAGTYEIRLYFNYPSGGYIIQARKKIKVK